MKRRALTLIETLAVIGVIGLLLALLLPAISAARESGRRAVCLSRLQAIGQALANYEAAHHRYPMPEALATAPDPRGTRSPLAALLPLLDQAALYDRINFSLPCSSFDPLRLSAHPNHTAFATAMAIAVCPSDRTPAWTPAPNNYRFCTGASPYAVANAPGVTPNSYGAFAIGFGARASEIEGGLAHTAAASERLTGSGIDARPDRARDNWYANPTGVQPNEAMLESIWVAFIPSDVAPNFRLGGGTWLAAGCQDTWYNHASPPNSPRCDLSDQPNPPVGYHATAQSGYFAARSQNRGGVNIVMLDGSAHWSGDSIDLSIWKALGTLAAD